MKIEESFRDVKSKMGIDKIMSKNRENYRWLILFALLSYNLALIAGEFLRKVVLKSSVQKKFSGLHVLFALKLRYNKRQLLSAIKKTIRLIRLVNSENVYPQVPHRRLLL